MICQVCVGYCSCCDAKVCRRCGQCHRLQCEGQVAVCRMSRGEKPLVRHRRRLAKGAQRRLREA